MQHRTINEKRNQRQRDDLRKKGARQFVSLSYTFKPLLTIIRDNVYLGTW